jgi:hypothetical protein
VPLQLVDAEPFSNGVLWLTYRCPAGAVPAPPATSGRRR